MGTHHLSSEQADHRLKVATDLFSRFRENGNEFLSRTVAIDKTWMRSYNQSLSNNYSLVFLFFDVYLIWLSFLLLHIRAVVFVLCGNFKKISPYIHLMLLLYINPQGLFTQLFFSISFLRRLPEGEGWSTAN